MFNPLKFFSKIFTRTQWVYTDEIGQQWVGLGLGSEIVIFVWGHAANITVVHAPCAMSCPTCHKISRRGDLVKRMDIDGKLTYTCMAHGEFFASVIPVTYA